MILQLYSIHDRLAETYSNPMAMPAKIIMRQLEYILSDMKPIDAQDKECVEIGTWDNESGQLIGHAPLVIADLSELMQRKAAKNG